MTLRAGRLRHKVDIQSVSGMSDGAGGNIKTWSNIAAKIAAAVIPITGGEAFRQGMANNTQMYRVTMRFRTDVTARNRLIWNGLALNIRTCGDPDDRRAELVITAESGAGEP